MAAKEIPEPAENPIPPAKISLEEPPTVSLANKLIKIMIIKTLWKLFSN